MVLVLSKLVCKQLRYSAETQKNASFFPNILSLRANCRVFLFKNQKKNYSIEKLMKRSVENWYYNLKLNENWRSYATLKLSYLKIMEVAISTRLEPAVRRYVRLWIRSVYGYDWFRYVGRCRDGARGVS